MFERFQRSARQVVVNAQEQARELKHHQIGTEHLLLGMLTGEGVALQVLNSLGITQERVRAQVERIVAPHAHAAAGQIPFTPGAKRVLELSLREALSLGHNYIGTEHILVGLVREGSCAGMSIVSDFGTSADEVRNLVIRTLSGTSSHPRGRMSAAAPYTLTKRSPARAQIVRLDASTLKVTDRQLSHRRRVIAALVDRHIAGHSPGVSEQELAEVLGISREEVRKHLVFWQKLNMAHPSNEEEQLDTVRWHAPIAAVVAVGTLLAPRELKPPYKR